jgi:histidine ammonia-lyase
MTDPLVLDGASLTLADLRHGAVIDRAVSEDRVVYGVTTGFGKFADVVIPREKLSELQANLVRSHAAGVGEPIPRRAVRALMLLRANCLAKGFSGVRRPTLELLLGMLAAGVHPVVPAQGSVGASGDLAPLAHLARALLGEGHVEYQGKRTGAADALREAGLRPVSAFEAKEGLALINGTQLTTAIGGLSLARLLQLLRLADLVAALTIDVLLGTDVAFDPRIHAARPHPGQSFSAGNLRHLLEGSALRESHRDCGMVQDAYALRCAPQVHGAVRDAAEQARRVVEIEMNAATDNPMVFAGENGDGELVSGGNFHAAPVALTFDHLAAAAADLASISERRTERLVNPSLSGDLPAFLVKEGGLNSGFMMIHVTAAALVSECKANAFPASVDSIPTSAGKEDHVSMGPIAARKLARNIENLENVLAIELLAASQALDLRRPLTTSEPLEELHRRVRAKVPAWESDRYAADDIEAGRRVLVDELEDLAVHLS